MAKEIENPALVQIDNPPLTGQPLEAPSMPALGTRGLAGGKAGLAGGVHAQGPALENPPLAPATAFAAAGPSLGGMLELGVGRRLVSGVIPQIENPDLE